MAQRFLPRPLCCVPSQKGPWTGGTHKLIAFFVHVVLQVAAAIVGGQDGSQLPIACNVEAVVGGKHQQPRDVAPANFLLRGRRWGYLPQFPVGLSQRRGDKVLCLSSHSRVFGQETPETGCRLGLASGLPFPSVVQIPVPGAGGLSLGQVPKCTVHVWDPEGNRHACLYEKTYNL